MRVPRVRFAVESSPLRAGDVIIISSVSGKNREPIELAFACRDRARSWRILQELAGTENVYARRAADEARTAAMEEAEQAGASAARAYAPERVVTVCMKEVEFHKPVWVGDIVSYYAWVTKTGSTSITVKLEVIAERFRPSGKKVKVTEAEVVYVAVDAQGRPVPIKDDR